jgi:predicted Zn finger-like uncharacterized protein
MLIVCPSCDASYDVPDSRMRPGRRVRCVQCHAEWVPLPAGAADDADSPPDDRLPRVEVRPSDEDLDSEPPGARFASAMDRLAARSATQRASPALRIAWIASLVLLAAGIAAGCIWRDGIMHFWPPSARLFAMVGLAGDAAAAPH